MGGLLAWLAGALAAVLHLAGALKTTPAVPALPFDLTLASLALLLPLLALLLVTRRWAVAPALALPLAAAALLWLWLVVAGSWSVSRLILEQKLPEVALAAPLMLAAGLLVGAEPVARAALCRVTLGIGLLLGLLVGWSALAGWQAQDLAQMRVHHQLAGLALATAAALAALAAVEARGVRRLAWLAAVLGLGATALLPGGRTALAALVLGVALAPALRLGGRGGLAWLLAALAALAVLGMGGVWLLLQPGLAEGLRTLERLTSEPAGLEARQGLWQAALGWAGLAAPWGLGTGGFAIAAGHGEWRGMYPHNHALEALAEGGLPGIVLWLGAFGGAALVMVALAPGVAPARLARIAALVLPVAMTILVSTDLGNRMAWFALGLALSLGLTLRAPGTAQHPPGTAQHPPGAAQQHV